jgi:hypothetical protein
MCRFSAGDPQKVALEEHPQPLEEAFLRKVGRRGESRIPPWSGGAKSTSRSALLEHRGEQGLSIPFPRKWLKSS